MPGWPSPAERRALDAFPEQIGPEDLDEHFKLSPADLRFALKHRGDSRLGVARAAVRAALAGVRPRGADRDPAAGAA